MDKKQPLSINIPSYADKAKKVPEHGEGDDTDEGWTPAARSSAIGVPSKEIERG